MNFDIAVKRSAIMHGDKYEYLKICKRKLKRDSIDDVDFIKYRCKFCGKINLTLLKSHINSINAGCSCNIKKSRYYEGDILADAKKLSSKRVTVIGVFDNTFLIYCDKCKKFSILDVQSFMTLKGKCKYCVYKSLSRLKEIKKIG